MSEIANLNMSGVITFVDRRAVAHELTTEAAVIKGGAALVAVKDMAFELALSKALNGKYRSAAEILGDAFSSQHKAYAKIFKAEPWANKTEFASYLHAMENAQPGKNGYTKKQVAARQLIATLRGTAAFAKVAAEALTVDA